jgi:hypothetical protein
VHLLPTTEDIKWYSGPLPIFEADLEGVGEGFGEHGQGVPTFEFELASLNITQQHLSE